MPTKLREYMSHRRISSSNIDHLSRTLESINAPGLDRRKYHKAKSECLDILGKILEEISLVEGNLDRKIKHHYKKSLKKFNEDYDEIAKQIVREVQTRLEEQKQIYLKKITMQEQETTESKNTRRHIVQLKEEALYLRQGLQRQHQFRKFISVTVLKDFDSGIQTINDEIQGLRFPLVDVRLNGDSYSGLKSSVQNIIKVSSKDYQNIPSNQSYDEGSYPFEKPYSPSSNNWVQRNRASNFN